MTERMIAQLQEQADTIKGELKADLEEKGIEEKGFVLCPVCGRKTRQKARKDTY